MIALEVVGGVATLSLDRAAARNALAREHWEALGETIRALPDDAALVVLRSAVPGVFSAGADLAYLSRLADDVAERACFAAAMGGAIEALAALPMPTVAVIEGACMGAAVALSLACDLRIASPAARFAVPPARLGIGYPPADVARLAARVGQGQAARLLFTGETIDVEEARRIGLVEVVADAEATVATIAGNDRDALRLLKAMLTAPDAGHAAAFAASFASARFRDGTARYRG